MDMNSADMVRSVRLSFKKSSTVNGNVALLRDFLKKSSIRTIMISGTISTDGLVSAAKLLSDDFRTMLECDSKTYGSVLKKIDGQNRNMEALPVYDIANSISELKKILSIAPVRRKSAHIFIKNDKKLTERRHIAKVFDVIIKETGEKNVKFFWDCGFVLCTFSESQLGFFIQKGSEITFACPSVANIDDKMTISLCGRLKQLVASERVLPGGALFPSISAFGMSLAPYRSFGIYPRCGSCSYFQKTCSGGCKESIVKSFR